MSFVDESSPFFAESVDLPFPSDRSGDGRARSRYNSLKESFSCSLVGEPHVSNPIESALLAHFARM